MADFNLNLTLESVDDAGATVRSACGDACRVPPGLVPAACRPGDAFCIDSGRLQQAIADDAARAAFGRLLLNDLLRAQ